MVSRCYLGKRKNIPVFNANRNHSEMLRVQLEPESSSPASVRTEKQASCMAGRTQNGALSSFSNVRVTIGPSNSTPRCTAEKTEHTTHIHTKTCTLMSTEGRFTTAKGGTSPSAHQRVIDINNVAHPQVTEKHNVSRPHTGMSPGHEKE